MKVSCVYIIRNIINGKFYIGSTFYFSARKKGHIRDLSSNKHHSFHLQKSWNLHGEENFTFEILEKCPVSLLLVKEQYYLDLLRPWDHSIGYNICKDAGSTLGFKHSDESKKKISESNKGKNHPMFGKNHSRKSRNRISISQSGKIQSKETRNKRSKPIDQYSKDGVFIRRWDSGAEILRELGSAHISRVCTGKRKTAIGFSWKFSS